MKECETNALIEWLQVSRLILSSIASDPWNVRDFKWQGKYATCPEPVSADKRIPYAKIGRVRNLGPTEEYSYEKEFAGGKVAYWVPKEYLP